MTAIKCEFTFEYESIKKAKIIKESLEPDNEDFIEIKQIGSDLKATCKADTPMELLNTIDDFLACLTISEDSLDQF